MALDPRFAGGVGALGMYNAPPAAGPLQIPGPQQQAAATQDQNANYDPNLSFHGGTGPTTPQELEEAANILQYASMDELHVAFSSGPPQLKELVNSELQRRIATGDPNPKQEQNQAAAPAASAGPLAGLPPSGPTPDQSGAMPDMPSRLLSPPPSGGLPGPSTPRTPPGVQAVMPRAISSPLAALPSRGTLATLRPAITRQAIAPGARVPARRGAPETQLTESDLLNLAEASKHRRA